MLRVRTLVLGLVGWMMLGSAAQALVVDGLYDVAVTVEDRAEPARMNALPQALANVLAKVSGRDINSIELSAAEIASQYLEGFRYKTNLTDGSLEMVASFSRSAVNSLLASNSLPVLGNHRPDVILWIGSESGGRRELVSEGAAAEQLKPAFDHFAIPVVFPTGDLEDSLALPVGRLFGLFRDDVRTASARYGTAAIVAARLMPYGKRWRVDGYLEYGQDSLNISEQGDTAQAAMQQLATAVAGYFSGRFGIVAASGQEATGAELLSISQVNDYGDYQAVMKLIGSVSGVKDVAVKSVQKDVLTLAISVRASWQQVLANIRLDRRIKAATDSDVLVWKP
ncbi:DUF2066 domain-containing protein [Oceanobacter mangrovi]|uniref:DUF2066 domain-containing protein n=1 Tax=Oceanobacter mangrovi TaxID=2862510 RepID=UPI001C8E8C67|nr:DUF2066 domain-containing protein [Oceanobacter mangrovi]